MARTVGIGIQDFGKIIENDCFYVDKTYFIKEWWESQDEKFRALQGTYPVISLSFANVKETNYRDARAKICQLIASEYARCAFLLEGDCLTEQEKNVFRRKSMDMGDVDATLALNQLSEYLYRSTIRKLLFYWMNMIRPYFK